MYFFPANNCCIVGAVCPHSWSPRKQQLCSCQHQHWARGLGVVRSAWPILGGSAGAVREEQRGLPARELVAQDVWPEGGRDPLLQVHAETRRGGLGQYWLRALGAGRADSYLKKSEDNSDWRTVRASWTADLILYICRLLVGAITWRGTQGLSPPGSTSQL